jgi:hypothetical protein
MRYAPFAMQGGRDLKAMMALLAEFPEGVSEIGNADKLAGTIADELKASVATNPPLKATGPVLDPKLLFQPQRVEDTHLDHQSFRPGVGRGKAGLRQSAASNAVRVGRKHPSPLGFLYVIDEAPLFIPSAAGALSTISGAELVARARKYGLGMIAVTQAPKGIDNKVISNCTTQLLSKLATDQQSVESTIAPTGRPADDIGKLTAGEFYFKT